VARLALLLRRTYATREEAIARYRFLPASDHAREELRLAIAQHTVREESDGRFGFKFDPRWFSIPSRPPPSLSAVRCPTLVLRGSESTMLTAPGARALAADLPHATCEVIEGAGHHIPLDQPASFLAAVERFFDPLLDASCHERPS
jgi:pimeloyl-ACP methyl ester carboxylesterase